MAGTHEGGEPFEEAIAAIADFAAALRGLIEEFDTVERQVRNARMTDALELSPLELAEAYPEVEMARRPAEEPYEFWIRTEDAALVARIAGALRTTIGLVDKLGAAQPPAEKE